MPPGTPNHPGLGSSPSRSPRATPSGGILLPTTDPAPECPCPCRGPLRSTRPSRPWTGYRRPRLLRRAGADDERCPAAHGSRRGEGRVIAVGTIAEVMALQGKGTEVTGLQRGAVEHRPGLFHHGIADVRSDTAQNRDGPVRRIDDEVALVLVPLLDELRGHHMPCRADGAVREDDGVGRDAGQGQLAVRQRRAVGVQNEQRRHRAGRCHLADGLLQGDMRSGCRLLSAALAPSPAAGRPVKPQAGSLR